MELRALEGRIRELLAAPLSDERLRDELERLAAAEISFSGFTWLWGPALYRRNRILFSPFIGSRFSSYMTLPKWRIKRMEWKGARGTMLDAWLAEVDRNDDVNLFRKLYEWKLWDKYGWRKRDDRSAEIIRELLKRFKAATSAGQRHLVLRKLDLGFGMDEPQACELYEIDSAAASPFILRHLKISFWSGDATRQLMQRLIELAAKRGDENFQWKLYRRQVPLKTWTADALGLCDQIKDNEPLVRELEKRHPEGYGVNVADGFLQLVKKRGRDVFPYVQRHLQQVWGSWFGRGSYGKIADYARERGWWDFWAALVRTCSGEKEFNQEIARLVEDKKLPEQTIIQRLLSLAGVSREWNFGGFGAAAVHQLSESAALKMYERFPDLIRGPFKLHIQSHRWGETYPKLLNRFLDAGEEELIDYMASRLVTRYGSWGQAEKMMKESNRLADYYGALKSSEADFSRRAANVLGQVPAYSIWNYNELIRQNRLARLLFERSAASYLADPRSMADLIEGAEIHVMALGYRALGLDDDRARTIAANHLPLLLGTLLRPMQRATRMLAFGAVANASETSLENARLVLDRARDACNLPDKKYPKEKLLGLIARVLRRWPELRGPKETPVVYESAAA